MDKAKIDEVIEYRPPINNIPTMERPPFNTAQVVIEPTISPALLDQIKGLSPKTSSDNTIANIGDSCKNKSCKANYTGTATDNEVCRHHPGVAIFHEGLKYWSCCQKKTTDFTLFLEQPGCTEGTHLWIVKV